MLNSHHIFIINDHRVACRVVEVFIIRTTSSIIGVRVVPLTISQATLVTDENSDHHFITANNFPTSLYTLIGRNNEEHNQRLAIFNFDDDVLFLTQQFFSTYVRGITRISTSGFYIVDDLPELLNLIGYSIQDTPRPSINDSSLYYSDKKSSPKEEKPTNEPYKEGLIVYDIRDGRHGLISQQYAGKIIKLIGTKSGQHLYTVDFLHDGEVQRKHNDIMPTSEEFDYLVSIAGYESLVDCENLFSKGDKFTLKNEYLYSKNYNVILSYIEFKSLFKKLKNDTIQKPTTLPEF